MLSYEQAKRFYDRIGAKLDTQRFYEQPALAELAANLELTSAERLIEFGCGTGRFAEELFAGYLSPNASYIGVDVSSTMVELAQTRTAPFGSRAVIRQTNGEMCLDLPTDVFDRFISTYVLDLLSEKDIESLLKEAHRVLMTGGLLGVVSLTRGSKGVSRLVTWVWERLSRISPILLGGCRPIEIKSLVEKPGWYVRYGSLITRFAITSEIVVAEKS